MYLEGLLCTLPGWHPQRARPVRTSRSQSLYSRTLAAKYSNSTALHFTPHLEGVDLCKGLGGRQRGVQLPGRQVAERRPRTHRQVQQDAPAWVGDMVIARMLSIGPDQGYQAHQNAPVLTDRGCVRRCRRHYRAPDISGVRQGGLDAMPSPAGCPSQRQHIQ